jgi:hypothetical protein
MDQLVGAVEFAQPSIRQRDGRADGKPQSWIVSHQLKIYAKAVHFFQRDFEIFDDVRDVHATTNPTQDEVENSAHFLTGMLNFAVVPPKLRNFSDHEPRQTSF